MGKYQYKTIVKLLEASGLTGRGGASYPTWKKWQLVHESANDEKYVVCNGSEGEPGVFKDHHLLTNFPQIVVQGVKIAVEALEVTKAFLYLRSKYFHEFKTTLDPLCTGYPIECFEETGGYLAGEETTLIAAIQGNYLEPASKPPFPPQSGLWDKPTLISNVETFYTVAKIVAGDYKQTRWYSITDKDGKKQCIELPVTYTAKQVLQETGTLPEKAFFVQLGGGASGPIMLPEELNQPIGGSGAIIVYDKATTDTTQLMKTWAEFFHTENCDKCIPCREGAYRIKEMLGKNTLDLKILNDLFFSLENTSYCALGKSIPLPFQTLLQKILNKSLNTV